MTYLNLSALTMEQSTGAKPKSPMKFCQIPRNLFQLNLIKQVVEPLVHIGLGTTILILVMEI